MTKNDPSLIWKMRIGRITRLGLQYFCKELWCVRIHSDIRVHSNKVTSRCSIMRVNLVIALQTSKYNLTTTWMKNYFKIVCSVPTVLREVLWLCDYLLIWWSDVISVYDWIDYVIICYLKYVEIYRCSMILYRYMYMR